MGIWYARTKMGAVSLRIWFDADPRRGDWVDESDPDDQLLRNAYVREAMSIFKTCLDLVWLICEEQQDAA